MAGLYSITTRADGTTLTAAIYNSDHQNHVDNHVPGQMDDISSTVGAMQSTSDPGEVGSESQAISLEGELKQLRHLIAEITGNTYWYESPANNISELTPTLGTAQALTGLISHTFTGIPSWVKKITVTWQGVTAGSFSYLAVKLGDAGGIESSGYISRLIMSVNAANPTLYASASFSHVGLILDPAHTALGSVQLTKHDGNMWLISGSSHDDDHVAVATGSKELSGELTQLQFLNGTGVTFTGGKVNILYE